MNSLSTLSADPLAADLVVAGGGPGGWATAIRAAELGADVVLVEPRAGAVDKACGEGLLPAAVSALGDLGVRPVGHALRGISYANADGTGSVVGRFRSVGGVAVRRTELSSMLATRGVDLGVRRLPGSVGSLTDDGSDVRVDITRPGGPDVAVRARWLAAADGLHSPLRRRLGLEARVTGPPRHGLRRHFRLAPGRISGDVVRVFWAERAEAYVTPVTDEVINVAILSPGGAAYAQWLTQFPAVLSLLEGATALTGVRGGGPLRQQATARSAGRTFLVGDAAGYTDALTGEGVAAAVSSGTALAECLASGRPRAYEARWHQVTRATRARSASLLAVSSSQRGRQALLAASRRFPRLFTTAINAFG